MRSPSWRTMWSCSSTQLFAGKVTLTNKLGRAAGRWVPIVGWGVLAYDAYRIGSCVADSY
jgi:hypothetical protein